MSDGTVSGKAAISGPTLKSRRGVRMTALAALVAAGGLGFGLLPAGSPAVAQFKPDASATQAPFARAPLTFADIVEKVKPAVVSISVTGAENKVAKNELRAQLRVSA